MKKRSMLAIASLATGFVVAAVTPSHGADGDAVVTPSSAPGTDAAIPALTGGKTLGMGGKALTTGGKTKLAGIDVDKALDTFGRAINRETDRAVNNAPHGKHGKNGKNG
ncbi:hypothetical protein [Streptomyces curacoi]|uniref:ATP-binding protein n=1 Tax=Streptomyces curacoi TaxID=146536 RepID=A0A117P5Q4_9ACTN|nr:hypothetical protein [Streptomyces curacoi]KUM73544.1 hypothetical protein AQI70_22605 [Streptomyces curacoi]